MSEQKEFRALEGIDFSELYKSVEKNSKEAVLAKYTEMMQNKQSFNFVFPMRTKRGTLFGYDGDDNCVQIRMPKITDEVLNFSLNIYGNSTIGDCVDVCVMKVDEKNGVVSVSPAVFNGPKRLDAILALKSGVESKEYYRVPAKVIGFAGKDSKTGMPDKSVVLVNIANLNILGSVRRVNWSVTKVKQPSHCTNVGDVFDVIVTGVAKWGDKQLFDCSRRLVMENDGTNPWTGIETKVPKNTEIEITCVDKYDNNFFGVVDGLTDIEVLCDYPSAKLNCPIVLGHSYRAKVKRVSEEDKKLCGVILGEVKSR